MIRHPASSLPVHDMRRQCFQILQTIQQLRFLAIKLLIRQNPSRTQSGEAFNQRDNVFFRLLIYRTRGRCLNISILRWRCTEIGLRRLLKTSVVICIRRCSEICLRRRTQARPGNNGQTADRHRAVLTAKRQRCVTTLLLADATNTVIQRVVNRDLAIKLNSQPLWKYGIADIVLRTAAEGAAEIAGPPLIAVTRAGWCHGKYLRRSQYIGEFIAQVVDGHFQAVVEHVADHRHAAAHPLATAAQLRAIELRHAATAIIHSDQHLDDGVLTEVIATRDVANDVLAGAGELLHDVLPVGTAQECPCDAAALIETYKFRGTIRLFIASNTHGN